MKIKNLYLIGRNMYLAGIGVLGFISFILLDFAMTRPKPWPPAFETVVPATAYISGSLMIISVILIFLNRLQKTALAVIASLIFLLATSRHIMAFWDDKVNAYKSLVLICGCILIYYRFIKSEFIKNYLLWGCLIIVFAFFEYCAIGHFVAAEYVQLLIPNYIPFPLFFTYFAGVCLALAGVGLLIPALQKITALLSGIQITGWFILLHVPRAVMIGGNTWIGVGESLSIAGVCFLIYGIVIEKKSDIL